MIRLALVGPKDIVTECAKYLDRIHEVGRMSLLDRVKLDLANKLGLGEEEMFGPVDDITQDLINVYAAYLRATIDFDILAVFLINAINEAEKDVDFDCVVYDIKNKEEAEAFEAAGYKIVSIEVTGRTMPQVYNIAPALTIRLKDNKDKDLDMYMAIDDYIEEIGGDDERLGTVGAEGPVD